MIEHIQREYAALRSELATLHQKLEALQAGQIRGDRARTSERGRFLRRVTIGVIAVAAPLIAGGFLYGAGAVDALFIDQQGRVGIGTADPKEKLHVVGPVLAEGFRTASGVSLAGVQDSVKTLVPIGTIMAYAGDTANPTVVAQLSKQGWLPCNGAAVSRQDYTDLFTAIGTAFGTDAPTTFRIPDLRGRFLRGTDQNTKRDPDSASRRAEPNGANIGDQVGSVQEDQFKQHTHEYKIFPGRRGGIASGDYWAEQGAQTGPAGGSETRPKNINVNWIITAKLPAS